MKNYIKQNSGRFILGGLAVIALVAGSIAKIISSSYAIDGGITNLSIVDDTNAEVKENANISIDKTNHTAKIYNVKIQAFFPQEVEGDEYVVNKNSTKKNLPLIDYINSSNKRLTICQGDLISK